MMVRYLTLAKRIQQELEELERTQEAIHRHWHRARTIVVDQDAYLNSVALNLHSLYSGLERIFELIANEFDGGIVSGENWHAALLRQMSLELPGSRPAVLQPSTATALDEYRKFRHIVRNVYATNLDPQRMAERVAALSPLWAQLRSELDTFIHYLNSLSQADE